jgi:large subunit ribosomal protein L10
MLTKDQKKQQVEKLSKDLKESKTSVICGYKGMTVPEISELRSKLYEQYSSMQVIKKTLMKIALKKIDVEVEPEKLDGQIAIVYGGDDEIFSPKTIHEYAKTNENLEILAGILEGKLISADEVKNLAKLPTREELLAKVVGSAKAPISGFVNVLSGNLRNLVFALSAIKETKEATESKQVN